MAYMSTEEVKEIRDRLKKKFPAKSGWKLSVTRQHHSTVCVSILEAPLDLREDGSRRDHYTLNEFYPDQYGPQVRGTLKMILDTILGVKEHHNPNAGDMSADYPAWNYHMDISVGRWDRPFKYINRIAQAV